MEDLRESLVGSTAPAEAVAVAGPAHHGALALAHVIAGIGIVYLRVAMNVATVDSISFTFWRYIGATPLLLAVAAARGGFLGPPTARDAGWFAVLGGLLVLNQLFANYGIQLAGALARPPDRKP